jgi:hypothetical protein
MKKLNKIVMAVVSVVTVCAAAIGFAGCGESKTTNIYIASFASSLNLPDYGMEQPAVDNYVITTYEDGNYDMVLVKYMDMYGTDGSVTIVTTGTYESKENADGDQIITLSDATSISYTTCGMFTMQYSWNTDLPDTEFPVEFLGSTSAHNSLEDLQAFGKGFSFKVIANEKDGQNNCTFELVNG